MLIYSMTSSLDGYIAGPGGDIGFSAPSQELHRFHNEQVRELGAHLLGRRLYETMAFWDTPEPERSDSAAMREFAPIWRALPKIVFSRTLTEVQGEHTRLARAGLTEELAALGDIEVGVGGADLAAACAALGLIDEYRVFVCPVLLGGGTPHFGEGSPRVNLELAETRTFENETIYLRYRRVR